MKTHYSADRIRSETITFTCTKDEKEKLIRCSVKNGMPLSGYVRSLLVKHLAKMEKKEKKN